MHFLQNIESGFLQLLLAALIASLLLLGNRNCLFLKMTNISHVAGFAIAFTHNFGLTIIIMSLATFEVLNVLKNYL